MLRSKQFVRKTRKGKVLKVLREHYLRDDIWCGCTTCKVCNVESATLTGSTLIMIDTNVALHQMDFLEHNEVQDIIVPSIVREEVKHRNTSAYNRLTALLAQPSRRAHVFSNEFHRGTFVERLPGESSNDRNDRAIRAAASWYQAHVPHLALTLLTDDRANLALAEQASLKAMTVMQWAQEQTEVPELVDLVANATDVAEEDGVEAGRAKKRQAIYQAHLPEKELQEGMRRGELHQGTLRTNRYNPSRAAVSTHTFPQPILIQDHVDMNRAVDGDRVVVRVLPEEQWGGDDTSMPTLDVEGDADAEIAGLAPAVGEHVQVAGHKLPTGRVVGIIKRGWRPYSGSLDVGGAKGGRGVTSTVLFVPHDARIPKIRVRTRQLGALAAQRVVVVMDAWSTHSRWPDGHYVRTLGERGDKAAETQLLLAENDINHNPFTEAVYACVPPLPWDSAAAEIGKQNREDFRREVIFSVDPPGCRDIDDALHIKRLGENRLEVGVHIADVTHFVHPGSAVDVEAADRCTSVYLVDRRIDMLPKALTEDICSLRANVERLTFSAIWEVDDEGNELSVRFTKGVIKSCAAMTYQEAQTRIDDARLTDNITTSLRLMNRLAKQRRQRRTEAGSLSLASPEVKFQIDTTTHDPMDVGMYQVREVNQMVEEMMLMANISVADKILRHYPQWALLRRHQTPAEEMFDGLRKAAAAVGVEMNVASSRALALSLDAAVLPDPYFNKLIRILATRCMTQAQYICTGDFAKPDMLHYGLAAPIYTHFTSPIRRYADVVVHRFLAAAIDIAPLPQVLMDKQLVKGIADQINYRHRNAQMAGRASVELYTLIYFANRVVSTDSRIVKVKENAMVVFVPKYGIEGVVWLNKKGEKGLFQLNNEKQQVVSTDGNRKFSLFDTVWVKISVQDQPPGGRRLVLELLDGAPKEELGAEEPMDTIVAAE